MPRARRSPSEPTCERPVVEERAAQPHAYRDPWSHCMTELRDVVICAPLRTPVGRMGGALATVPALELATTVLGALLERTDVDPVAIDGVIGAQAYPTMEAPAIGRVAALDAGFPVTTNGYQ